ncbi:class I SAM-dependent methyltransferase [Ruminococcaceae bacterium OttesenSCG-928-I18]|nr:class I SAM-dependent methyltransferase [Ruminococcaceae bacterium OttesenSCG-928-I18]
MERSRRGLAGAGEWPVLQKLLPDFAQKEVLDLGCGFGWHCAYAARQGAKRVVGVDLSEKMLAVAKKQNAFPNVEYRCHTLDEIEEPPDSFDIVLSSLALHYLPSFDAVCEKVAGVLRAGGLFVFTVEHPVFTAYGTQQWLYDENGEIVCWPVDRYFERGPRQAEFLGETVCKYHRTLTDYLDTLLQRGFEMQRFVEPMPTEQALAEDSGMADELRRPMMMIICARNAKKGRQEE